MQVIGFLILFPVLVAALLMVVRGDKARSYITVCGAGVIAVASLFCALTYLGTGSQAFAISEELREIISWATFAVDLGLCFYIVGKSLKYGNLPALALGVAQGILMVWAEFALFQSTEVAYAFYIDNLSIIMALIIGIIGSGICVYAIGYMRDYQRHAEGPDRRPTFFALMFVFLGAMYAIVFSNDLTWLLCGWEVTTVCSFALIGFTRTPEAIANSFRQIIMNLLGGLAFAIALVWSASIYGVIELDQFISVTLSLSAAGYTQLSYLPLLLLALAGFTKAAQMPFQTWLLGAMVAPTPTSALLHSSTMVKAGVFLLIKLSPCFGFNIPGFVVMMVGGVTFLFCAFAAISQSNAKRVLAYSTISNLGLIVACAGVGSDGALWAAIFLLVFHACAKSLLFLCVGTAEHHIGSRDIEAFDDLFERMPKLARLMAIGILGMFIAPFGMLISKWAAMSAFAEAQNVLLLLIICFGSAATFLFWAKWLGKILAIANNGQENVEETVYRSEWSALGLMTVLVVGCCIGFPLISQAAVVPYLETVFSEVTQVIATNDLWIMAIIALVIAVVFLGSSNSTEKRIVPVYMAGAGVDLDARTFKNSFGQPQEASQRNWYLADLFEEKRTSLIGVAVAVTLLLGSFGFVGQSVAEERDTVDLAQEAQVYYSETVWATSTLVSYNDYLQYYLYYASTYEEYAEIYAYYYGLEDMVDFMDYVYEQTYAAYETTDEEEADDADDEEYEVEVEEED